jgi:hypothetical protein
VGAEVDGAVAIALLDRGSPLNQVVFFTDFTLSGIF